MVVLIDSNIILDYMLKNQGFFEDAEDVLVLAESGKCTGYVSASAITDIYYIARKAHNSKEKALSLIRELLDSVYVALVDEGVIRNAVDLEWIDFEDAVQFSAGNQVHVDYIVTRDPKGFSFSTIEVVSPKSLLAILAPE
jgi:predicted nucleic acid-binding protein